jgi:hypothetical protein
VSGRYIRFPVAGPEQPRRAAALERLAARAAVAAPVTDWRADALQMLTGEAPPLAPAAYQADGLREGASVAFASPVHYQAEMTSVRMSAALPPPLPAARAQALATEFNQAWGGSEASLVVAQDRLYCVFDRPLTAVTTDPGLVAGRHIEAHLPVGADGKRLRLLMSELEMWLFGSAFNRAAAATGELPVTALWLWGQGALPAPPLSAPLWCQGRDVFFSAVARGVHAVGAGVVLLPCAPGAEGWSAGADGVLAAASADLKAGRIGRLHLSGGTTRFSVSAASLRRWWRRARPWWEQFV